MNSQANPQLLGRLWRHMSPRRHAQITLLLALMILASCAEILSVGAVLPFLAILTDPGRVFVHPRAQTLVQALVITEPKQILLPLIILFGLAVLVAGAMHPLFLRLSYAAGADLNIKICRGTLYQPYAVHVARNCSEIIDGISSKTNSAPYHINLAL